MSPDVTVEGVFLCHVVSMIGSFEHNSIKLYDIRAGSYMTRGRDGRFVILDRLGR